MDNTNLNPVMLAALSQLGDERAVEHEINYIQGYGCADRFSLAWHQTSALFSYMDAIQVSDDDCHVYEHALWSLYMRHHEHPASFAL